MSKRPKPSRKHHYVTQAQLEHFAYDKGRPWVHVFDKATCRSFESSVLNAGSENDFNTIIHNGERLIFEPMFDEVDGAGADVVRQIIEHRSLSWMREEHVLALADLGATQLLRTKLARETPGVLAKEMRDMLAQFGADLDAPELALPTETDAKLGAIAAFRERGAHRTSFLRLAPGLVEPAESKRFLISDHPTVFSNPFPYGDHGLQAQGIMVHLPLSPTLLLTWHCPTIIARLETLLSEEGNDHAPLRTYGQALVSGKPVAISDEEIERYNMLQVTQSRQFLYSQASDFDWVRSELAASPVKASRASLVHLGKLGQVSPPRPGMPAGWNMVVHGPRDHCLLHLEEFDEGGEGITARTSNVELLDTVAEEVRLDFIELYNGSQQRQHLGQVKLEKLTERGLGWFRAVHSDESLRALDRQIRKPPGRGRG
ncbi:DUF4238 domain-containing protein [Maricaulis sp.]|uniref:DUF4238 domain-containing protein n=1 Tax=Maricaulis sp. TaxID=1486257 RepID=UPI003A9007C7